MSEARLIYGFHAVLSRLRQRDGGVREIYLDQSRSDHARKIRAARRHAERERQPYQIVHRVTRHGLIEIAQLHLDALAASCNRA